MSLHKRPDSPHWQIRFRIAGRTIRCSSGESDRAAAEEYEEELRRSLWRQIKLGEKHFTWDQAAAKCKEEDSTQPSWERTERSIARLNRFLMGSPLAEITRENILKIRTALTRHTYLNADRKPVPLSQATINRDLAVLRSILKRCSGDNKDGVNWKMLDKCPKVPLFKLAEVDPFWVTREQAHKLLGMFPKHTRGMMIVALATGMRRSNVTGMEWSRVDLVSRTYYVPATKAKGRKKGIPVALNSDAIAILEQWKGVHPRYVFSFRGRAPIKQVTTKMWRRTVKAAGLEGVKFQSLRHSWASWHVQGKTPLRVLQEMGGWTSLQMPMRYSHLDPGHLAQYAETSAIGAAPSTKCDTLENPAKKARGGVEKWRGNDRSKACLFPGLSVAGAQVAAP
jgi:integrase